MEVVCILSKTCSLGGMQWTFVVVMQIIADELHFGKMYAMQ